MLYVMSPEWACFFVGCAHDEARTFAANWGEHLVTNGGRPRCLFNKWPKEPGTIFSFVSPNQLPLTVKLSRPRYAKIPA